MGGGERSEPEGLYRGFCCFRQPLSQSALRRIASSPSGEPFGVLYKLLHSLGGPPMTAPTLHITNLWQKHGDAQRPHSFIISYVHPPSGGFHMAEPYFTLQGNISPVRRTDFTAHVSALSGAEFYRHPIAAPLRHPKNPAV